MKSSSTVTHLKGTFVRCYIHKISVTYVVASTTQALDPFSEAHLLPYKVTLSVDEIFMLATRSLHTSGIFQASGVSVGITYISKAGPVSSSQFVSTATSCATKNLVRSSMGVSDAALLRTLFHQWHIASQVMKSILDWIKVDAR